MFMYISTVYVIYATYYKIPFQKSINKKAIGIIMEKF